MLGALLGRGVKVGSRRRKEIFGEHDRAEGGLRHSPGYLHEELEPALLTLFSLD